MTNDTSGDAMIRLEKVSKWFGDFQALRDIDMTVDPGERVVICGPSGSGKSTLIRCILRLEEHESGRIVVDGIEMDDDTKHIAEIRAEVGMVFQQFNLFPHLSVLENCTLGPMRARGIGRAEAEKFAMEYQLNNPPLPDRDRICFRDQNYEGFCKEEFPKPFASSI